MDDGIFLNFWFPVILSVTCIGLALSFWIVDGYKIRQHQGYLKTIINHNISDLVKILESIYVRADMIENDDQKAKELFYYFARQTSRIELIRLNVENYLVQITKNTNYKLEIHKIIDVENWLLKTYNRLDISNDYKFYIWKEDIGMLKHKTKIVVNTANSLKITKPLIV